jgi:hypothetical protein
VGLISGLSGASDDKIVWWRGGLLTGSPRFGKGENLMPQTPFLTSFLGEGSHG